MCGIVGYLGKKPLIPLLLESLKLLEYRGYDSSGIATLVPGEALSVFKASGKLINLERLIPEAAQKMPVSTTPCIGIGHIRWATHGAPTDRNAHPHLSQCAEIAVVHNGIIENDQEIRSALSSEGVVFASDTDSECIAQLLAQKVKTLTHADSLLDVVRDAVGHLRGAYALALAFKKFPDRMIAVRQHAPLVIGVMESACGETEYLIASDAVAIAHLTQRIIFLKDRQLAEISPEGIRIMTTDGEHVSAVIEQLQQGPLFIDKKGYKHFMLKEIYEQPDVVRLALSGRLTSMDAPVVLMDEPAKAKTLASVLEKTKRLVVIGCGSSFHASLVGKVFIEGLTGLPVTVDSAGEFRYRPSFATEQHLIDANTLVIGLSQSGETADTLEALRQARHLGATTLVITNREDATMGREADYVMPVRAGVEVSVCATKSFIAQVVALYLVGLSMAELRPETSAPLAMIQDIKQAFFKLPSLMESVLSDPSKIQALAKHYVQKQHMIFMGRTFNYPVALEGALKLKEVSYLHAEGYSGSELKHGPIAMLDANMPVVALLSPGPVFDKMISNCQEVRARDTDVVGVIGVPYGVFEGVDSLDPTLQSLIDRVFNHVILIPETNEALSPLLNCIPLQFLAYYMAVYLGKDVDQPRNLAKSVTVE
ncbi:MAG: glutamine--fructose-6-phosphate transaminase (isomerizing) [Vampirovibrionales bacterium]|nr:glutamine--fructose-6-phosphate transaminase (isomerizing) [Vampirovibrionales bacterium]